ncbi:hypothetical protein Droror1_Dr00021613 [Drosera rotundifolia]
MVEETGSELRSKSAAPATKKDLGSELARKPRTSREEGEVSSSDDDVAACPVSNVGPISKAPADTSCSIPVAQVKAGTMHKPGKTIPTKHPAGSSEIPPGLPMHPGHRKGLLKNQGPFTSSNPRWTPYGSNNDLVIRFSDDDDESGSDADQQRQTEDLQSNSDPLVVNNQKKTFDLRPPKVDRALRISKHERTVLPKKDSMDRISFPSLKKVGGPNSRSEGSFLPELRSYSKKANVDNRSSATQDHEGSKSMTVNISKLQDLRQKIAIRENELKLKAFQTKVHSSYPLRAGSIMNVNSSASKRIHAVSVDIQSGQEEPDRKRLKHSCSISVERLKSVDQHTPLRSVSSMQGQAMEKSVNEARSMEGRSHQESEVPQKVPVLGRLEAQTREDAAGCSLSAPICKPGEALVLLNSNATLPNSSLQDLQTASGLEKLTYSTKSNGSQKGTVENMVTSSDINHQENVTEHGRLNSAADGCSKFLQISPGITSPLHFLSRPAIQRSGDVDLQSLLKIEEFNDKELEKAQEYRRMCEIEEQNALKAYRKAQRAVAEANARCAVLYQRRESYAAKISLFLLDGGWNFLCSGQHEPNDEEWNFLMNPETEGYLIPTSNHRFQAELDASNQVSCDSSAHRLAFDAQNRFSPHTDGQNIRTEACSEPDASTSDLAHKSNGTAILSPPTDQNISGDEETFPFEGVTEGAYRNDLRKENQFEKRLNVIDSDCELNFPINGSQDSLLLEAELRSKLVSRFGLMPSSKRSVEDARDTEGRKIVDSDAETTQTQMIQKDTSVLPDVLYSQSPVCESVYGQKSPFQKAVEAKVGSVMTRMIVDNISDCFPDKSQIANVEGLTVNPEHDVPPTECKLALFDPSTPIIRSVFHRLKPAGSETQLVEQHNTKVSSDKNLSLISDVIMSVVVPNRLTGGVDSYTWGSAIDPFWPLCMYELRGKCNNEECPWQHSKDYSKAIFKEQDASDDDGQAELLSNRLNQKVPVEISKVLIPPAYLISLNTLGADSPSSASAIARKVGPSWGNIFSTSLVVSSSLQRWFHSDEPFLHGSDSYVEIHGSYNRQNSCFRSRSSNLNVPGNNLEDKELSLEKALQMLYQEPNKAQCLKKSLTVLSRALEADPTSLSHWVVYLNFYYGDKHSVEEDDMFLCAVEHNERSYELWLMYINSRKQLSDRFSAYEKALTSLCHHSSTLSNDEDVVCASTFILDVFLQMLNCFSLSGNVDCAIQRILGLLDRDADGSRSLLFSDILSCLSLSDKFIFWASCIYLVMYKKLPDKVVQQFEYDKEMFLIEWAPLNVRHEDKEQLHKMIDMASDLIEHGEVCKIFENNTARRSCHLFAINLVKLGAALYGLERCRNFLEKCMKLHPSCVELVLLSVLSQNCESESLMFSRFEEAISNWTSDPGIHCIWNQYAEYAIRSGRSDKAKDIMVQWFNFVWKLQKSLNDEGGDSKNGFSDPVFVGSDGSGSHDDMMDAMFGFLNLSLYSLLQNDLCKAYRAINKSLMMSGLEGFTHCVREHASFWLNYGPELGKDVSINGAIGALKTYLYKARSFLNSSPLTRRFIQDIQKPRLRKLVTDLFSPVSPGFSTVNLVLETWFGSSLLPQKFGKLKDLVDFVEAVLEVSPSNYPLALSVCKLLTGDFDDPDYRSASTLFWASSLLSNTIYLAVPLAPEYVWVEASGLLGKLTVVQEILDSFHHRALTAYPFSVALWRSFLLSSADTNTRSYVVELARERGIEIECA